MRYINSYENDAAIQAAVDNGELGKPYVALNTERDEIDWNTKFVDYANMPLTFKITGDGLLNIKRPGNGYKYSLNNSEYIDITQSLSLSVKNGDIIRYKIPDWGKYYQTFQNSTAGFIVYGNPKYGVNNIDSSDFREIFSNCTGLTDARNLYLSSITLANSCYQRMFQGCTSLTTAPALPATTLANNCYSQMFEGCTSLTTAPELPATTLTSSCYSSMFSGCTSLTTAPELPATTLAQGCYSYMFNSCTSLTTAPSLPATTLASGYYTSMFQGCTNLNYIKCLAESGFGSNNGTYNWVRNVSSTGTFVKKAGVTWPSGASGIPNGWTVVEE